MIELIIEAGAKLYDAVMRGICWAATLGIVWMMLVTLLRKSPAVLKAIGAW